MHASIGVDLFHDWGGGGVIGVPCEGAKRPSGGRLWEGGGCGRGIPPPTVGTLKKLRVLKSHFRAFKNDFLGN